MRTRTLPALPSMRRRAWESWVVCTRQLASRRLRRCVTVFARRSTPRGSVQDGCLQQAISGLDSTPPPLALQVCVIPAPAAPGLASAWANATVLKGQVQDPAAGVKWQGWYSQAYDDAWAAPTLVYDTVASGTATSSPGALGPACTVFAWLLVPTAVRRPCPGSSSFSVVSVSPGAGTVVVRVAVAGQPSRDVPVSTGL
jgi:hypothetical protein